MKCVADRDYFVNRHSDRHGCEGEIRSLSCAYCVFAVLKRSTPKPRTSSSGLGRYNRMRAAMVRHLHEMHRNELEAAQKEGSQP